jgi:flavin-dependent dehydrogenase
VLQEGQAVCGVAYADADGSVHELRAPAVIDATGTACLLSRLGVAGERRYDTFGDQIAIFSQFEGAERDPGEMGDNTFIYHAQSHHWAWFIPLSPTLVSVGIVVPRETFMQNINPDLTRRCAGRPLAEPIRAVKDYSYRIEPFAGPGWFCIGDSHRFADPIFSFGVTASMQEARAAVDAIVRIRAGQSWRDATAQYAGYSDGGQQAIYDFINYFWKYPGFFGVQMRGRFRKDVVRLFGGDIFVPNAIVDQIREYMNPSQLAEAGAE